MTYELWWGLGCLSSFGWQVTKPLNTAFKVNATLFQCLLIRILHHQKLGWPHYLGQDSQSKKVGWRRDLGNLSTFTSVNNHQTMFWSDSSQSHLLGKIFYSSVIRELGIFRRSCGIVLSRSTALVQVWLVVTFRKLSNLWESYDKFLSMWLIHRGNIQTTILK